MTWPDAVQTAGMGAAALQAAHLLWSGARPLPPGDL